ncbi:mycothiol synthase [Corynebacterium aquilae]|uniref:Mycothiol acetyltransferase n=1 Tax=Corynebacterium aquilae DSM 44791 TaxID=1431546 RepID=A0A1L7CHQ9_9CORY|nr:mycothiol synthase [Corynebacterium aquilae]APT85390.1 hypothetical protein CAQU_10385 [Corynebacterium aquilae DSM 44791]
MFDVVSVQLPVEGDVAGQVQSVIDEAFRVDRVEPLSEAYVRAVREGVADGAEGARCFIATLAGEPGRVCGVAVVLPDRMGEMVVDPRFRRRGVGDALVDAMRSAGVVEGVWAHGNVPAAQGFAWSHGWSVQRELLVMRIENQEARLAVDELAARPVAGDLVWMDYPGAVQRFGQDWVHEQWLRVNNDAFDWHPEQGGWDEAQLRRSMAAQWFDPQGVLLLVDEQAGRLVGFHYTKWHGSVPSGQGSVVRGEVYVVGLHRDYQGRGLGSPLVAVGVKHLFGRGAAEVILYVEADNEAAVATYERMGFGVIERHVVYAV